MHVFSPCLAEYSRSSTRSIRRTFLLTICLLWPFISALTSSQSIISNGETRFKVSFFFLLFDLKKKKKNQTAHTVATASSELFPLLHFVLDDLPTKSRSPKLDDTNARSLASAVHCLPMRSMVPRILSFLVASGFLAPPTRVGAEPLPPFEGEVIKMDARKA